MSEQIRVLHVDDQPDFADLTATALERADDRLSVQTATGADAGLDRLTDAIDCVVSDYDMPGRNGIDFLQAVRERYPDLPFILFTGKGSEEVASDAISAGVTDYLEKEGGLSQYTVLANRIANAVEQYRSKRALEASQRRLSLFFEQSPLGVIEWNEEFEVVRLNDAAEDILGYAETDLRGASWERIIPESETEPVGDVVDALLRNQGGYRSVNGNVRADGDVIVCEWHNRVVTDDGVEHRSTGSRPKADDGEVVAIFSQFQDITERTEREQQLERSTARLEALFENSPDMINVHDTDGNIIDPNPRLCEQTGYSASELVDMKVWDVDARIDPAEARSLWEEMDVGDRHRLEGVYRHRDGSTFPVEIHIQRLDLAGEDRFVVISRDISARKARERELQRQNERLEEFVGVVSHDLQNPLNVAAGRLELADEECDSDHLDAAAEALGRMDELIADLLQLAREGERVNEIDSVALADVLDGCWQNVETGDADLVVETERTIRADPGRLRHLLENLLRNSVGHGPTRGRTPSGDSGADGSTDGRSAADSTPDHVTITVGTLDDGFYVEDDGVGIPEAKRTEVFESGYSTAPDGTGFGLAIVAEVVEAHGWSIRATESAAGGARFEITGVECVDE